MARTRIRMTPRGLGVISSAFGNGSPSFQYQASNSLYLGHDTCEDDTGRDKDNPLLITHIKRDSSLCLNGELMQGAGGWNLSVSNWMPGHAGSAANHLTISNDTNTTVATATQARSNPSRPDISLPNFVYELKDLPGMVRDIGRLKLKWNNLRKQGKPIDGPSSISEAANWHLATQFGWAPLISDIRKMLDFESRIDKRIDVLNRLFIQNEGLHRTVGKPNPKKNIPGAWSRSVSTQERGVYIETAIPTVIITANVLKQTTSTKWGSVRWTSSTIPSNRFSNAALRKQALDLVFGANLSPTHLWNALPWSWLVDWFGNVGDFVQANYNAIPVTASLPCVMEHVRTETQYTRTGGPTWVTGGSGTVVYETKRRSIVPIGLSAALPFISARQFSILGALAIQRGSRNS